MGMTKRDLTDEEIWALAAEAEEGYDVKEMEERRKAKLKEWAKRANSDDETAHEE